MSRKYLEQMIEEMEYANYQRCLQANGSFYHTVPPAYPEFRPSYSNRYDYLSRGCYIPPYMMLPNLSRPNCESFYLVKRNEHRGFYKNFYGDKYFLKENRFHSGKWNDSKNDRCSTGDIFSQSGRRYFMSLNAGLYRFKENRDDYRFQKRSSRYSKSDSGNSLVYFQRYGRDRLDSSETPTENVKKTSTDTPVASQSTTSTTPHDANESSLEDVKTSSSDNVNSQLAETSVHASSTEINTSYASWYYAEEQQQIVNMLREVNMRHERQLKRDMAVRSERPCSDDSISSNVDQNDSIHRYFSSDDEDDGIVVLVSPEGGIPPADVIDPDEEHDLGNDYLEKSVSDYFEEFQSIFTVSPEKNIINTITKECMKDSPTSKDSTSTNENITRSQNIVSDTGKESLDENEQSDRTRDGTKKHDSSIHTEETRHVENEVHKLDDKICTADNKVSHGPIGVRTAKELNLMSLRCDENNCVVEKELTISSPGLEVSSPSSKKSHSISFSESIQTKLFGMEENVAKNKNGEHSNSFVIEDKGTIEIGSKKNSTSLNGSRLPTPYNTPKSSESEIIKIATELQKKDGSSSSNIKTSSQPVGNQYSSGHKHGAAQKYSADPAKSFAGCPTSLPVSKCFKSSDKYFDYKVDRFQKYRSNTENDSHEMAFWRRLPHLAQRTKFPQRRDAKSETRLTNGSECNVQMDMKVSSYSESHLPFKNAETYYRRISVDDLFQEACKTKKTRDINDFIYIPKITGERDFGVDNRKSWISASDHLKKILKIGSGSVSHTMASSSEREYQNNFHHQEIPTSRYSMNRPISISDLKPSQKACDDKSNKCVGCSSSPKNKIKTLPLSLSPKCLKIQSTAQCQADSEVKKIIQTSSRINTNDSKLSNLCLNSNSNEEEILSHFQQPVTCNRLTGNSVSICVNKNRLSNSVTNDCKIQAEETLSNTCSIKCGSEERSVVKKAKKKRRVKHDKSKVKNDASKSETASALEIDQNDKLSSSQMPKMKGTYRKEFNRRSSYTNYEYSDKNRYCDSRKDIKCKEHTSSSSASKGSNTVEDHSCNIYLNVKDQKAPGDLGNTEKEGFSKGCGNALSGKDLKMDKITKEKQDSFSTKTVHLREVGVKPISYQSNYDEKGRKISLNSTIVHTNSRTTTVVCDGRNERGAQSNTRYSYVKPKDVNTNYSTQLKSSRKSDQSRMEEQKNESFINSISSKSSGYPSKSWRYDNNSRYLNTYRYYYDKERLERDRISKATRSEIGTKSDYKQSYERKRDDNLDNEDRCYRKIGTFTSNKSSNSNDSKLLCKSKSGSLYETVTGEKLILESIYSYSKDSKTFQIDDTSSASISTNDSKRAKNQVQNCGDKGSSTNSFYRDNKSGLVDKTKDCQTNRYKTKDCQTNGYKTKDCQTNGYKTKVCHTNGYKAKDVLSTSISEKETHSEVKNYTVQETKKQENLRCTSCKNIDFYSTSERIGNCTTFNADGNKINTISDENLRKDASTCGFKKGNNSTVDQTSYQLSGPPASLKNESRSVKEKTTFEEKSFDIQFHSNEATSSASQKMKSEETKEDLVSHQTNAVKEQINIQTTCENETKDVVRPLDISDSGNFSTTEESLDSVHTNRSEIATRVNLIYNKALSIYYKHRDHVKADKLGTHTTSKDFYTSTFRKGKALDQTDHQQNSNEGVLLSTEKELSVSLEMNLKASCHVHQNVSGEEQRDSVVTNDILVEKSNSQVSDFDFFKSASGLTEEIVTKSPSAVELESNGEMTRKTKASGSTANVYVTSVTEPDICKSDEQHCSSLPNEEFKIIQTELDTRNKINSINEQDSVSSSVHMEDEIVSPNLTSPAVLL